MHRLNRAEYANAIRDLLALDIDATALLPPDDESSGFDNIADVLTVSPSLMERYLSASWNISRMAVGNLGIAPSTVTYRVRPDLSQDQHIDGLPPGTRGGILVQHTFPLDGEYIIKLRLWRNTFDLMRGMEDPHDIEIAMDGVRGCSSSPRAAGKTSCKMAENPGTFGADLDRRLTVRIPVKAGTHTLWATTVLKSHAAARRPDQAVPADHRRWPRHHGRSVGGSPDDRRSVRATGSGDTRSRRKILLCRPAGSGAKRPDSSAAGRSLRRPSSTESACATRILSSLARLAYRRPVDKATLDMLMDFYRRGRAERRQPSIAASSRRCSSSSRVRSSCSASKPDPPADGPCRAAASIGWTTSRWRRGCRSFSGAAFPTSSC